MHDNPFEANAVDGSKSGKDEIDWRYSVRQVVLEYYASGEAESIDVKKQKNKERKAAKKAEQAKEAAKQAADRQQQHIKAKQKEANPEPDAEATVPETLEPDKLVKVKCYRDLCFFFNLFQHTILTC